MRFESRIWLVKESLQWAIAEVVFFAIVLGGLWCLLALVTGLRRKARKGNDRW